LCDAQWRRKDSKRKIYRKALIHTSLAFVKMPQLSYERLLEYLFGTYRALKGCGRNGTHADCHYAETKHQRRAQADARAAAISSLMKARR